MAIFTGDRARQHGAYRPVAVANRHNERHFFATLERGLAAFEQLNIQRLVQAMILLLGVPHAGIHIRLVKQIAKVQAPCLPVLDAGAHVQQIGATDKLIELADTQLRHDLAHFFGNEEKEIDDMLGLALELFAQHRILCRDTDRTGIQMAFAHHDASLYNQRGRRKTEFVGPQQRANDHIASGLHLAVSLHPYAAAQFVEHQRLLGFRQSQLPRGAGVLDGRNGRRPCAAVMSGNHDVIGLGLGHAGRHRAHANLGHQLGRDGRRRIDVFQIVNQLRQIFNRINIMMRRRRNQTHARHRITQLGNVFGYFVTRQLAALAGLGALRHLDLNLVCAGQIFGADAKTARGYLFDF